jgi:hypothetical protein
VFRYLGLRCPNTDCKTFIVWKQVLPGDPEPTVRALDFAIGTCPACKKDFSILASEMTIMDSESPATHFNPPHPQPLSPKGERGDPI